MASCLAVAEEPAGFAVNTYEVSGENPLSAQATAAILEPYKGVKHGLSDLTAAAKGLEQSMRAQGFIALTGIAYCADRGGRFAGRTQAGVAHHLQ